MIRLAAMTVALMGLTTPSPAAEWIACRDAGGEASFDMLVGALDVLGVVGLTISAGDQVWASDVAYGPGEPLVVGQAFGDATTLRVDVMDESLNARIAELRLFRTLDDADAPVLGGTLRIPGHGAWAVSCSGP